MSEVPVRFRAVESGLRLPVFDSSENNMDQEQRLAIFEAQTQNVRGLQSAMKQVHRSINAALRSDQKATTEALTKLYALLFCGWAEANFSKIIHTPYGFELDEISQIKQCAGNDGRMVKRSVVEAWRKSVDLGLRHLDAQKRGNFQPNAKKKLFEAIDAHVFDPSLLRNKLAHGQWVVALNRTNERVQQDLTDKISNLTIVDLMAWVQAHQLLADMVEALIESPKKTFMRDWHSYVVEIETRMQEAEQRTLVEHIKRLKSKSARKPNLA